MNKLHGIYYHIQTPLGTMLAIANQEALLFLQFIESNTESKKFISLFENKQKYRLDKKQNSIINQTEQELQSYFQGTLKRFTVSIKLLGTIFQQVCWKHLLTIPYGQTTYYNAQAASINFPQAHRAVAQANKANNIAIIIPCHRVIQKNNSLGGYRTGIQRKNWLLSHERTNNDQQ